MELRKQSQFALKPKLKILDIQYVSSFFHSVLFMESRERYISEIEREKEGGKKGAKASNPAPE